MVILGSLLFLMQVSAVLDGWNQTRHYKIVTAYRNKTLKNNEKVFEECSLQPRRGPQQRLGHEMVCNWYIDGSEKDHERCIKRLLGDPDVKEFVF